MAAGSEVVQQALAERSLAPPIGQTEVERECGVPHRREQPPTSEPGAKAVDHREESAAGADAVSGEIVTQESEQRPERGLSGERGGCRDHEEREPADGPNRDAERHAV